MPPNPNPNWGELAAEFTRQTSAAGESLDEFVRRVQEVSRASREGHDIRRLMMVGQLRNILNERNSNA